ncbi:Hydroxymethylpyrimidine ABC transporter, substrate-binding component [Leucobacter sp. 7(1)]|nr:Hydroxymethylpyrimidine ABC transporter, substrate-binding component [Leucobacter sp. 7(1)]
MRDVRVVLAVNKELAGENANLHVANELGYAEENGIRFVLESALGSTDGTKLVSTGQAEVAYPSPFVALTARASGVPIVSVFDNLQTNIFGFAVKPNSPIASIADLKGKKVALGDGGWTVIAAPLLASAGLTIDDVEWVVAGERRQLAVEQGDVDAVLTWEMEYQNWADQGLEFRVFGQDSVPYQSNTLVMSEELVKSDPDLVKAIARASAMGAEFIQHNPEAGAQIATQTYEGTTPQSLEGMTAVVTKLAELMAGGEGGTDRYGAHRADDWQGLADSLFADGVIGAEVDVSTMLSDDFIDYANDFDRDRVRQDAEGYKP